MNNIALLEYDADRGAVISPDHEQLPIALPEVAVFAFVGDIVDTVAVERGAAVVAEFVSITRRYPIYRLTLGGRDICLCAAPMGAAPAVQIMDWLIAYGVKRIISTGSCGVLVELPENAFLVPDRALRDEGTSFHYLPPARYVNLKPRMVSAIAGWLEEHHVPYTKCTTWTTDGFFRETKAKVLARRDEDCAVVEMECAALAACAEFRDVEFGQFLFTADSLHAVDAYNERGWGIDSMRPALEMALEMAAVC